MPMDYVTCGTDQPRGEGTRADGRAVIAPDAGIDSAKAGCAEGSPRPGFDDPPLPAIVDMHMHVYESKALGAWGKADYEIWEYGAREGVQFSEADGDLDELRDAMHSSGVRHAVIVHEFSIDEWRGRWLAGVDQLSDGDGVRPIGPADAPALASRLIGFNEWLVEAVRPMPEITPFVAVDPWLLSFEELAAHLQDMRRRGARGVKIHPVDQRFLPDDPRMLRVYALCVELELIVLSHSGTARGNVQFAEPRAFAAVAQAAPDLRLVLAHMGGGSWRQLLQVAKRCPRFSFDLSEIEAWTGAPNAPTDEELVRLIREVGVERVMFGSDFPWYDPGDTIRHIRRLPGLSQAELDAILGENAVRIMSLPV